MILTFKDFVPEIKKQGLFSSEYESLRECLDRANEWIEWEKPDVMNVETVVLDLEINSESSHVMCRPNRRQFIRVWYKKRSRLE